MNNSMKRDTLFLVIINVILFCGDNASSTIDVNLNELEYLVARLNPFECRRLVAALHYATYDLPNNLVAAERKIDEEIPCLRQLLHWNNNPGEGKGKTHEYLVHRLRQINRNDLADWLGKNTFKQLGIDLQRAFNRSSVIERTTENSVPSAMKPTRQSHWGIFHLEIDYILQVVLLGLIGVSLFLILMAICIRQ